MKVVSQVDTNNWRLKHVCQTCESVLEAEKDDIIYFYNSGYYMKADYETWKATCPVCQVDFNIPLENIPKALQAEIRSKS